MQESRKRKKMINLNYLYLYTSAEHFNDSFPETQSALLQDIVKWEFSICFHADVQMLDTGIQWISSHNTAPAWQKEVFFLFLQRGRRNV